MTKMQKLPVADKRFFRVSNYSLPSIFVISFAIGMLISIISRFINFKGTSQSVEPLQVTPIPIDNNGVSDSYARILEELNEQNIFTSNPKFGKLFIDHELLQTISGDEARKMMSHLEQMLQHMAKDAFMSEKMQRAFRSDNFVAVIVKDKGRLQKSSATFDSLSNTLYIYDSSFLSRASMLRLYTDLHRVIHQINIFRCRGDGNLYPFYNEADFLALSAAVDKCNAKRISTWNNLRIKKSTGSIGMAEAHLLERLTKILEHYTPKLIPAVLTDDEKTIRSFLKDLQQKKKVVVNNLHLTEIVRYQDAWVGWGTFYPDNHPLKNESNAIASRYDTMWRTSNFPKMLHSVALENNMKPEEFILQEHDADIHMHPEYTRALCEEVTSYHRNKFGSCK